MNVAKQFAIDWKNRGNEMSDTQIFWLTLIRDVFNIAKPEKIIQFEQPVEIEGTKHYIDALIPSTKVLIEQKSIGVDLDKASIQSDGKILTPFEQAKRYADELPYSRRPRWIVTCNFEEFRIYDLDWYSNYKRYEKYYMYENLRKFVQFVGSRDDENNTFTPEIIKLERLFREYENLNFLVDPEDNKFRPDIKISSAAGEIVKKIYNAFEQNNDSKALDFQESLNKLCVRLVFCLYAEDADVFAKNQFFNYLKNFDNESRLNALLDLFTVLNQPKDERSTNLDENLAAFPYVNGGLFHDKIDVPNFNDSISFVLFSSAMQEFDWSGISPTIFGALFESTLNPFTRRIGGMHYTSIENIHKVIDPLFMDELHDEFKRIKRSRVNKLQRLRELQNKLSSLKFLDPACGSGNFLTETYLSLRRLENEIIREINRGSAVLENPVKVSINQFYGIEINDFAVAVAQTALWIAESQMLQETEMIINHDLKFLPLKTSAKIIRGNALEIDWHKAAPNVDFVIGNPPFVGYTFQTDKQKSDLLATTQLKTKKIDYVVAWYYKAAQFIQDTKIRCSFVSTNSICQGEQVAIVWKTLFERYKIHIDFAYRTFKWTSESKDMASVYCVIIGFSQAKSRKPKMIYDGEKVVEVKNINAYLVNADNIFISNRKKPLCDVPNMVTGNRPADGQNLIIEAKDYDNFINYEPKAKPFIKQLIGAEEFINRKLRYCLWLVDATQDDINNIPLIKMRVEACRRSRQKGAADRQKLAKIPHLFRETLNPESSIVFPEVSSALRKYIPIGYINNNIICTNRLKLIPNANLYHFGVLTSNVHMMWTRIIAGYLGTSFDYSIKIVYNNFVWCQPTHQQRRSIEKTAQNILIARLKYPDWSLAKLYDEKFMPDKLRKAHEANDIAVMSAYGFDLDMTESEIVAELMRRYENLTADNKNKA